MADGSTLSWSPSIFPPARRLLCLCRMLPHLKSIRRIYLPDDRAVCVPFVMAKVDTLSLGASQTGVNP